MAVVHCKPYHRPLKGSAPGSLRGNADRKSECPGWLSDEQLRQQLLDEALEDPKGGKDFLGRPKKQGHLEKSQHRLHLAELRVDLSDQT